MQVRFLPVGPPMRINPNFTVERLYDLNREQVYDHLVGLSSEDRRLRFCMTVKDDYIRNYVYGVMNFDRDPSFGAFINGRLVGLASICLVSEKSWEFAMSIEFGYRGTGLARHLMRETIDTARELGAERLCMSCLRENRKMRALAESFGLNMTITYDEAYAELGVTK